MKEEYADGVSMLMRDLIQQSHLSYEVATLICKQAVGTAVLCEEGEDGRLLASVVDAPLYLFWPPVVKRVQFPR